MYVWSLYIKCLCCLHQREVKDTGVPARADFVPCLNRKLSNMEAGKYLSNKLVSVHHPFQLAFIIYWLAFILYWLSFTLYWLSFILHWLSFILYWLSFILYLLLYIFDSGMRHILSLFTGKIAGNFRWLRKTSVPEGANSPLLTVWPGTIRSG